MLRETYWTKPVRVETAGRFRVISSMRAAGQWLLYHWPTEGGPEHRVARVACIAVLKNEQPPDHARQHEPLGASAHPTQFARVVVGGMRECRHQRRPGSVALPSSPSRSNSTPRVQLMKDRIVSVPSLKGQSSPWKVGCGPASANWSDSRTRAFLLREINPREDQP